MLLKSIETLYTLELLCLILKDLFCSFILASIKILVVYYQFQYVKAYSKILLYFQFRFYMFLFKK